MGRLPKKSVGTSSRSPIETEPAAHPVRVLQKKLETEFKGGTSRPRDRLAAALDGVLVLGRVQSKQLRLRLIAALLPVIDLASRGYDLKGALEALALALASVPDMPLPEKAPVLYVERPDKSQDIIGFLRDPDGWMPWIRAKSLTRAQFRAFDPAGYQALSNWLQKHGALPPDIDLPTRSEVIDELARNRTLPEPLARKVSRVLARRAGREQKKTRS